MNKLAFTMAAALVACAASATTTYTITTTAANTYESPLAIDSATVTVDDGETSETKPFSEVKDAFVAGSVFRKRGEGYLRSSASMKGFTGEIRIEEGGYQVITNCCLGPYAKESANPVVVSNGASLVVCPTLATCATKTLRMYNPMTYGGAGYEGRGAISIDTGKGCSLMNGGFSGNWTLTDDAVIGVYSSEYVDCPGLRYCYLQNHVLTIKQMDGAYTFVVPQALIPGGSGGRIVFDGPNINPIIQDTNRDWWSGNANNVFVLTNGSDMTWYIFEPRPWWTWEINEGSNLGVSGKEKYPGNLGASEHYGSWGGPVRLNTDIFNIEGRVNYQGVWLLGYVSGRGGIYANDIWLKLSCATNSFAGPVTVAYTGKYDTGLALYANGAVPSTLAGGITVTNATTYLGKAEVFNLPKLSYEVTSGLSCVSGLATRVTLPSLKKTGNGTLDLSTIPASVSGTTEVKAGTLKLNGAAASEAQIENLYSAVPGLWCGISPDTSGSASTSTIVYSNFVDSCFKMMRQHTYPPWIRNQPTIWGGYIWNRSPTNETWTFGVSARAMGRIYIDGAELVVNDDYSNANLKNKVMTPGPHLFRFAVNPRTSTPGSGVPSAEKGWTWASEMGIVIDRRGRLSKNSADYFFPSNNVIVGTSGFEVAGGDGSLFTRDARDRDDFTAEELRSVLCASQLGDVVLGGAATLDLGCEAGCVPASFGNFTGGGTVANGSVAISGTWTLELANRIPVGLQVTGGDLVFDTGAVLDCDVANLKPKSSGHVIATVSGTISGLPELSDRLIENGWELAVKDGCQLVLSRPTGLMLIVR